jgi:O-antigen/teichoic acid export membrane protein
MPISITKKDVFWSYLAQFFSISSGILVLPLVLHLLSPEEIGMNYLMLSIGSLVALFDFGFGPQFGRNITYIFGGAQELKKEGIITVYESKKKINYKLLATMIQTAKYVYQRLSLFVFVIMISLGTMYIYLVTNGFNKVHNSLLIWIIFSISIYFNMYYAYYSSLLIGKGMINESKKAIVFSRILNIVLTIILLILDTGLLSIAIANLLAPFVERAILYHYFFSKEMKNNINGFKITVEEKIQLFKIVWFNARKLGLIFIATHAVTRFSLFLAGLYLSLSEIASYGLMLQFGGIIMAISSTLFSIYNPRFTELHVRGKLSELKAEFALSMGIYYLLFIFGSVFLVTFVPNLLSFFDSKTELPRASLLIIYLVIMLLEGNHSNFSTMIVIGNSVPFVRVSLITGGFIVLGSFINLQYTNYSLFGLVVVQGIVQLSYNNWKWPYVVLSNYNLNFFVFINLAFKELKNKIFNTSRIFRDNNLCSKI